MRITIRPTGKFVPIAKGHAMVFLGETAGGVSIEAHVPTIAVSAPVGSAGKANKAAIDWPQVLISTKCVTSYLGHSVRIWRGTTANGSRVGACISRMFAVDVADSGKLDEEIASGTPATHLVLPVVVGEQPLNARPNGLLATLFASAGKDGGS